MCLARDAHTMIYHMRRSVGRSSGHAWANGVVPNMRATGSSAHPDGSRKDAVRSAAPTRA